MKSPRKTMQLRQYQSLDAMKDDQLAYWQQQPAYKRLEAVAEINMAIYGLKAKPLNVSRLQRTLVHLKR